MADLTPSSSAPSSAPAVSGDWQAAIAYFSFLFLYTAWAKSDSPSHMWHAKNGAGLFVAYLGLYIVMNILVTVLPVGMMGLLALIMNLINLAIGIASLWGAWNAWKGKQWTIPVITGIGQKVPLEKWFHHSATPSMSPAAPVAAAPAPTPAPVEPTPEPMPMTMPEPTPTPAPTPMPEPMPAPTPVEPAPAPMPEATPAPSEPTPPQTPAA